MKRVIIMILSGVLLIGCSDNAVVITGKVNNYDGRTIYLEKKTGLIYSVIDTFFTNEDQSFKIIVKADEPDYYRLNFAYRNKIPVMISDDNFFIEVDASHQRGEYNIKGSKDHALIEEVKDIYTKFENLETVKNIKTQYENASLRGDLNAAKIAETKYQIAIANRDELTKELVVEALNNKAYLGVVELLCSNVLQPENHDSFFNDVIEKLNKELPDAYITQKLLLYVENKQQTVKLQQNE